MQCRTHCGACCIAPSINFPYYGMPQGKPAGVACVHLDLVNMQCRIWQTEHYPTTCQNFRAEAFVCGNSREEALQLIHRLELDT
ncbi:hypothetical protein TDB9533_01825 [Thalassocella blandensis]|nr:hypothetical protein TDB9533_01825 [Thalassocella blandensis]